MLAPVFKGSYNAKLLLSAEYMVLRGATALAVPLRFGQQIEVFDSNQGFISWHSVAHDGSIWFSAKYNLLDFEIIESSNNSMALHPQKLFRAARLLNPSFLENSTGCHVALTLNYPIEWGLGSSSTLIAAMASWSKVDPYTLHFSVSNGSGYDIACALNSSPLLYSVAEEVPNHQTIEFNPSFSNRIFFVYQGIKKDSAEGIKEFTKSGIVTTVDLIKQSTLLTLSMLQADSLAQFELVMRKHEAMISVLIGLPSIKKTIFHDLPGEAKSLGAWGGDFCMITWNDDLSSLPNYLSDKGFKVFFNFSKIVLL